MKTLFTAREAADKLRMSVGHLANLRVKGKGPKYSRFGRTIVYHVYDLNTYRDIERKPRARFL